MLYSGRSVLRVYREDLQPHANALVLFDLRDREALSTIVGLIVSLVVDSTVHFL
jgi:hypothetical protein